MHIINEKRDQTIERAKYKHDVSVPSGHLPLALATTREPEEGGEAEGWQ